MTRQVLLTAFEPFNGESINPSSEAAQGIESMEFPNARIHTVLLPVARYEAIAIALDHLNRLRPEVVIMLGEAGRRARVTPERVAINVDDYRIPDNTGQQPVDEPVVLGGPVGYFSTLPIRAIVDQLAQAGIPASISDSAGTYLCNRLFYSVMHWTALENPPARAGFIHLPYLHEQVSGKSPDIASISRQTAVEAVYIAIQTTLDRVP
jgi:pyroglutamyl-peptidase